MTNYSTRMPRHNTLDDRLSGVEVRAQSPLRPFATGIQATHFFNVGVTETSVRMALPSGPVRKDGSGMLITPRLPTLAHHVRRVIGIRPDEEMAWSHADRVVAAGTIMAEDESFGNGPMLETPGNVMRWNAPAIEPESPITASRQVSAPKPAFSGLLDLCPETVCGGDLEPPLCGNGPTMMTAEHSPPTPHLVRGTLEGRSTLYALALNHIGILFRRYISCQSLYHLENRGAM